jgi:hypothetical protein
MALADDPFGEFCGQHTASILPNGHLLLFDNGGFCVGPRESNFGQFSRVAAYELEPTTGTARLAWDYPLHNTYEHYATSQGSAQYLANGHIVVGWGAGTETAVTEIDAAGNEIFAMRMKDGESTSVTYQALRFPGYAVPTNSAHAPAGTEQPLGH